MKISELEIKDVLAREADAEDNSFIILNYAKDDTDDAVTCQISLKELSNLIINNHKVLSYAADNNLVSTNIANNAYASTGNLGQYITADDRNVLDAAITNVAYDSTNKKLTASTRGGTAADIVTTASLLSDMDLNITQISNTAGKTIATIDEADGKVSATFQDISILSSQISDKGTAGCVATLDANGHVPSSQLPSYVDDVIEGTVSTFPATGETGKIYVDTTTNTSYRWSGSQYVKVASDLSLGETSSTAYRGDYGASAYAHAVTNKGSAFTSGLYKITTNSEGHVTAATAVQKSDITALDIPGSDTTYEMDGTYDASTNKVATVSTVTGAVSGLYTKPVGGIPASDLADTYFSIPELPTTDGTYTLQVVIASGEDPVFSWVESTT